MIAVIWLFILTVTFVSVDCLHKKRLRFYKQKHNIALTMPSIFLIAGSVFSYLCAMASIAFCFYLKNNSLYVSFLILSVLFSLILISYYACYAFCNENEIVKTTSFFKHQKIEFSNCDGYYLEDDLIISSRCTTIRISSSMKNYYEVTELLYSKIPDLEKQTYKDVRVRKFKDSVYDFQTYLFLLVLDVFLLGLFVFFAIIAPNVSGLMALLSSFMLLMPILLCVSAKRAHKSLFWDKIARFMLNGKSLKPFIPTIDTLAEQMERYNVVELVFCGKPYKIIKKNQIYNIFETSDGFENNIFSGNLDKILHYNFVDEKSLSNSFCSCRILHIYWLIGEEIHKFVVWAKSPLHSFSVQGWQGQAKQKQFKIH